MKEKLYIPRKVKLEVTLDIDRDVFVEQMRFGYSKSFLLNRIVKETTIGGCKLIHDHDTPIITAEICEED